MLARKALGVRAEALRERQQRLEAPAQVLGGGAADEGVPSSSRSASPASCSSSSRSMAAAACQRAAPTAARG